MKLGVAAAAYSEVKKSWLWLMKKKIFYGGCSSLKQELNLH
jgi:hypothetical protein